MLPFSELGQKLPQLHFILSSRSIFHSPVASTCKLPAVNNRYSHAGFQLKTSFCLLKENPFHSINK